MGSGASKRQKKELKKASVDTANVAPGTSPQEPKKTRQESKRKHKKKEKSATSAGSASKPSKSSSSLSDAFNAKAVESLFASFVHPDPADAEEEVAMDPDGIDAFFKRLGIDAASDVVTLAFAHSCGAARMGYFTKSEFVQGCRAYECDSMEALKARLAEEHKTLVKDGPTRELTDFVFSFARETDEDKTIDPMLASGLAALLFVNYPHGPALAAFLEDQTLYSGINRDQWMNCYEFCKSVDKNLDRFDENGAWNTLIDEFVASIQSPQE